MLRCRVLCCAQCKVSVDLRHISDVLRWYRCQKCGIDTPLAPKLVCMEALEEGYWTKDDGNTQRDVSQTERDQLNLMCTTFTLVVRCSLLRAWHFLIYGRKLWVFCVFC